MKIKRLIPQTIIPQSLYVERGADRQIHDIVKQGGRPGYVLVSRQMGKTNLLLHAKSKLQDSNTVLAYVDMSSYFLTAQECFRHIIDTAITTHPSQFEDAAKIVGAERAKSDLPPYKEHEKELTILLNSIAGNLVLILDEIDSLKRAHFSDQIFAQIRAVYFARANFPIFGRLTYLLSGVAEPKDLIKNRDMSPFNIGEKIYLDDFTDPEFKMFLVRAGIEVSKEAQERIYFWTGGNPRMLWDVCSAIEDRTLANQEITETAVDECVQRLYLNRFDIPPVDHIRTLVEEDSELQNALVEIQYLKGDVLSDATKNKLYLAGIIGSVDGRPVAKLKNRIIEATLSESWLRTLSKRRSPQQIAQEKFNAKDFVAAIQLFEENIRQGDLSKSDILPTQIMLAHSYFETEQYEKALVAFEACLMDRSAHAETHFDNIYFQGLCHFRLGKMEEAINCFNTVKKGNLRNAKYFEANVNLSLVESSTGNRDASMIENLNQVIEELRSAEGAKLDDLQPKQLMCVAVFELANVYGKNGDVENTRRQFERALALAEPRQRPAILLAQIAVSTEVEAIRGIREACETIVSNKLMPVDRAVSPLDFSKDILSALLANSFKADPNDSFAKLLDHVFQRLQRESKSDFRFLEDLINLSLSGGTADDGVNLAQMLIDKYDTFIDDRRVIFELLRVSILRAADPNSGKYLDRYMSLLVADELNELDIMMLFQHSNMALRTGSVARVESILAKISNLRDSQKSPSAQLDVFLTIKMQLLAMTSRQSEAIEVAKNSLLKFESLAREFPDGVYMNKQWIISLRDQAQSFLKRTIGHVPAVNSGPKIGRNDIVSVKYADGTVEKKKYKKVLEDISLGRCTIVDN